MTRSISKSCIETISGIYIDIANPTIHMIEIEDIAYALSREPRFAGHTIGEHIYSVAQHSVAVARIIEQMFAETPVRKLAERDARISQNDCLCFALGERLPGYLPLAGLLHDASEAYMRDIPTPIKNLAGIKEGYERYEAQLMDVIWDKFGLKQELTEDDKRITNAVVHWADMHARAIEAYWLMPSRGSSWANGADLPAEVRHDFELPLEQREVHLEFMLSFERYLNDFRAVFINS